jgi:poly(A) polymerase
MDRRSFHLDLPAGPARVLARLRTSGHQAFVVGGAVRDALRGEAVQDVDVATSATPRQVAELFERTHAVGARFGVMIVVEASTAVEVATFREDSDYSDGRHPDSVRFADLAADADRRDFTVNGLYYDPAADEVLDPVGGVADLERGLLRCIGEPRRRFREDRLRLLRCVRFAAQLGFAVETSTWEALVDLAGGIDRVSAERIRGELDRLWTGPRRGRGLRMLHYSGLLAVILPEISAMVGVPQPPRFHPEGDVFTHTCLVLDHLDRTSRPLGWGALLHDVGKPPTYRRADRIRFDGHVALGMEMARRILTRLRCDRATLERVVELVHLHLKFADVEEMRPATLKRFLRTPHFEDHLSLHRADCLGAHGDLSLFHFCRRKLEELREEDLRPEPLLRGRDLLELGFDPGPRIGVILRALEDEQLEGRLESREEAVAFVTGRWSTGGDGR